MPGELWVLSLPGHGPQDVCPQCPTMDIECQENQKEKSKRGKATC